MLLGVAVCLGLLAVVRVAGSSARPRRTVIAPAASLSAGEHRLGRLPGAARLRGTVVLRPRDDAALQRFIAAVSDPHSTSYHHYLRRGAFAGRFGPDPTRRAAVITALRADGLHVGRVASDGMLIPFSGSAAAAERTFGTGLAAVSLPGGGTARAPSGPISLPSSVAGAVAAVVGLDDTAEPRRVGGDGRHAGSGAAHGRRPDVSAQAAAAGPVACPEASADAVRDNGLTDQQVADAYGAGGLYAAGDTGAGEHIAVYELEPFLRSDVAHFDTCYFGAAGAAAMARRLHVTEVAGGQPPGHGEGEASLDVEDLSALAPGADIDVYTAPQSDALGGYAAIVDADRDPIVSTSWGLCEQALQHGQRGIQQAENLVFQQAAAQGQTVFAAAGDTGSDNCNSSEGPAPAAGQNPVSVDDPASQPYVVGVGGTAIDDATGARPLEHAWNDGTAYGASGGGISMSWAMPSWQASARVPGIERPGGSAYAAGDLVESETGFPTGFCDAYLPGHPACRLVPDVSAQADEFTGGITVYAASFAGPHSPDGWTTVGGTSSATPIWAASLALIDASPACSASGRVGFAAPLLYDLASNPTTYAASFNDVRTGNNDVYGLDNGKVFAAGRGYDLATGLGSPELSGAGGAAGLADDLCALGAQRVTPRVTAVAPRSGAARGGETITVHGSGFTASGRSQVSAVQLGTLRIPAARLHVRGARTITFTAPPVARTAPPTSSSGEAGDGTLSVLVTLRDGASSAPGPAARFAYLATWRTSRAQLTPTVGEVFPIGGPARGGAAVTVLGSGFRHVTSVTFGGVRARRVTVSDSGRLSAVPPARVPATACGPLPHHGAYRGEGAGNDICQVQVRVHEGRATSAASVIRPPLEGAQPKSALGDLIARAGCHCETAPAADEYDYLPRPRIVSVSTGLDPATLADEHGGTVITIHGSGLDPLDLDWADFGDPDNYASQQTTYLYASGTTLVLRAPAHAVTPGPLEVPFSVHTLAGQSNARAVAYAGVPTISSVRIAGSQATLDGTAGVPDTGATPIVIRGDGLADQVLGVQFVGRTPASYVYGTQYRGLARGSHELLTRTVATNPAQVTVQPCTVTGCTKRGTTNLLWMYPPGAPRVSAVSPATGPAAGGTVVSIAGANLGCPIAVSFGATPASAVTPLKTLLSCGSTQTLQATAPPGAAGATVPVTVQTVEGFFTHATPATVATFTYQ